MSCSATAKINASSSLREPNMRGAGDYPRPRFLPIQRVNGVLGAPCSSGRFPMERYQLAKIIEWAGTFQSRKRMQKLVFMLQAAG
jgi:hypothetical protein